MFMHYLGGGVGHQTAQELIVDADEIDVDKVDVDDEDEADSHKEDEADNDDDDQDDQDLGPEYGKEDDDDICKKAYGDL
jgi:hypothetical protein